MFCALIFKLEFNPNTMYRSRTPRRYGTMDYLMPFLIVVCVGVILVLLFQLWKALTGEELERAAYMHLVEGNAQLKTWGTEDFFGLSTDALIMNGDELVTSSDSRVIVEFFDGTIMRIEGGSDLVFNEISHEDDQPLIDLMLVDGSIWFNKVYRNTGDSRIVVKTSNLELVSDSESIFEVENKEDEVVRVIAGKTDDLEIKIYNEVGDQVVETQNLGVGQEVVFSDQVLKGFWDFKSPNVLKAVSADFTEGDWFKWNESEDKDPTEFEKAVGNNQLVKAEPEQLSDDSAEVDGEEAVDDEEVVEGEEAVEEEEVGEEESVDDGEAEMPDESEESEEDSDSAPEDSEQVVAQLEKPTLISVAGASEPQDGEFFVASGNPVLLTGTAPGAVDVVVNDFTLQKFQPGDAQWYYYANPDFSLIVEGENTYEVYSVDSEGNKSEVLTFKVKYSRETPQEQSDQNQSEETEETLTDSEAWDLAKEYSRQQQEGSQ